MKRMLALTVDNMKGVMGMLHCITITNRMRENLAFTTKNELPITLEMPCELNGTIVPSSIVVTALLWQQYGLDLLHPEVSRWLEKFAPDVKYAVARNQRSDEQDFRVGLDGTLKVYLNPDDDKRLRKVSSDYIWWQVEQSMDPEHMDIVEKTIDQIAGVISAAGTPTYTPSVAG
jgi:hypothetical protein